MAMKKIATFSHKCKVTALNQPKGKDWDIFNLPNQIKTASIDITGEDLGGFDLKEATKEHPDHLYIKIFAIKKDEPNDNGDSFDQKELKLATDSFVGVPLFTNHQNDDVEKARGECVHSWYDEDEGGIYIIGKVDKIAYPRLARGIEEGYISGTSMGCSVENSICSVCHNKANTADDYCSHVSNRKNRKYSGEIQCRYHSSPVDKDEKCPLCSSTKDDIKTLKHAEQSIFEHNYGLRFIENSFVVNPACHTCGVKCVLHMPEIQKKVASLNNIVEKLVKDADGTFTSDSITAQALQKVGGVKELNSLKNSMTEMEAVVKSMLEQKDNVSMEYVSDLVKAMADVQGIFDELMEMGYGALPSPEVLPGTEEPIVTEQFPEAIPPQNLPPQGTEGQTPGAETSDLGGLGNVTLPKKSSKNKEDFSDINQNIINKVGSLEETLYELKENIHSQLEIGAKMATEHKNTKTAAGTENLEVITEKQLGKQAEDLHPRTDEVYEGITESKEQIAGSERSNDTTSESPQVRKGTYETVTEDQLKTQSALGDAVIHFNDYPDVITEKQWDDFSRDIAGDLPDDYTESITQAQIRDLLSKHKFIGNLETITEDQLRDMSMTDGLKRWANKDYALSLVKVATNVVADAIATYRKSPEEIKKISSVINDNTNMKTKAAFLAVLNSLPHKTESRKAFAANASYFSKTASSNSISTIDALIMASADNADFGMKAEDVFDTVHHIVGNKVSMAKVDTLVKSKMNKVAESDIVSRSDALNQAVKAMDRPEDGKYRIKATMEDIGVPITDKVAFVEGVKKFAQEMINDEGVASAVIKIEATPTGELIIDVQDGAAEEICPDDIGDIIEGPVEDIDADINGEEEEFGGEEESKDMAMSPAQDGGGMNPAMAEAKKEIKTAQMMGGEMGGQGGASQAPGAGATLPAAPGMETPPVESFTDEGAGLGEEEGLSDNLEPLPPGSICPVCGSDDVDVIAGKGKCNNCSSEMSYKVEVNVTRWEGVTPSEDETQVEEEGFEGEGFEMPTEEDLGAGEPGIGGEMGAEMGALPSAASVDNWKVNKFAAVIKLLPGAVKKAASKDIKIGTVSPATGTTNTVKLDEGSYMCLDTGTKYTVAYMVSKNGKQVYGQWEWEPKVANASCPSCHRVKQQFVKALSSLEIKESDFDKMELKEQVDTIIKLKQAGHLKTIKTASKEGSVLGDYKLAYGGYGDSFPIESCVEKLSRRFGQNAICLSGPDEGKPLAESVCKRLKGADVYTSKIASKLAETWGDCDGDEECITHQVRSGLSLRQAAEICSTLKIAVAEGEDFLADEIAGDVAVDEGPVEDFGEEPIDDVDPFAGGEDLGGGTVTLELPIDIVEQLDAELDVALGEDPAEEAHHEDVGGLPDEEAPIDEPVIDESPVDESIAPGELDGAKDMMMSPATENPEAIQNPALEGGEMKPMEVGFEQEQSNGADIVEKKEGIPGQQSKTTITVDGKPIDGQPILAEKGLNIKEAMNMSGAIGKVGKPQMDLSGVLASLNKTAGEKEISQEKAQDSKDIGQYSAGEGGSLMGHENETIRNPEKPSVPRDNATMGQEPTDLNPQDKPQPVIPSDKGTMGHEDEAGLSGGDNSYTGGDQGQGKTELASVDEDLYHMRGFGSSKDGLSSLADRIAKKLAPKEPVAKDPDIQPISDGGTIGKEDKFDADDPTNVEGSATESLMGHESETIEAAPKEPADQPDVFTGNAQQGKEELDSEKTTKDKGTVIADSDTESEAIRVAGRMLQAKKIEASDLPTKISELKAYKLEQIKDIEKSIFASDKGLDTVSDGKLSQTVQINEASSMRNVKDELSKTLSGMFTLGKQNKIADDDSLTQLRETFK